MAERIVGEFILDSNYDISIRKPLDARSLVPAYEALTIKANWVIDGKVAAYNGMIVAVANTSDVSKNGIYFLFDPACTSKLKSPNVEDVANWHKVGETSDISNLVTRITNIESELANIKDRLDTVEEKQTEVFAHFSTFPASGTEGKLYIDSVERKSYVWIDTIGYLCVGEENPEIIYGGDANA